MGSALAGGISRADDVPVAGKEACASEYTESQQLRADGKLLDARSQAILCGQSSCPAVIRRECLRMLPDLVTMIPSVVIGVRTSDGKDVTGGQLFVDRVPHPIDGRPIELDPGAHRLECEAPGVVRYQDTLVASVGEKNRFVAVVVHPLSSPGGATSAERVEAPPSSAAPPASDGKPRETPVATYAFAGIAVTALVSTIYFGATGLSEAYHMQDTCSPKCPQDDVDSARTKIIVANVTFGIALVATGAALWTNFASRSDSRGALGSSRRLARTPAAPGLGFAPVPGGTWWGVSARF
jgi:hypothetical protein